MQELKNITLIAVDCYNYGKSISSLQKSMEKCSFGAVKFLTDIDIQIENIETILIPTISSKEQYSKFIIKELYNYIDTDFVLITQHDAWVLDDTAWDDEFLNYDYIGAPWLYSDGRNVGNGGFSLRSKRLLNILNNDTRISALHPEDDCIARTYRPYLESLYNIKFAPEEIADKFSFELREPNQKTFGFHSFFHKPYQPTIIIKRTSAIGDILLAEPIMRYFSKAGYNIVIDIPIQFFDLFSNHYFPIKHISQFDKTRFKPEKEFNLDMAYETKPRQNRLKSYFEFCGIKDYELSRPILFPLVDNRTKIFKKYAILHIDKKNIPHRNIYNVNWKTIKKHLEAHGYLVLQIGQEEHETIGIEFNAPSLAFLKFLIAGCDLFIGIDSAPLNIAMAYNKPCIGFFGSVNPEYVHPDLNGLEIIQQPCIYQHCYHSKNGSTTGVECVFNKEMPPCCIAETEQVIDAINNLQNLNKEKNEN